MTKTMLVRLSRAAPLMMLACVLGAPSVARGQTAAEIVAAHIKASGGEQAIARIENFTSKGRVTVESPFFGKLEGTIEAIRVPGRGYYEHVVLGPIEQTKGWDGAHGWELGPNGRRTLEGFEMDVMNTADGPSATMFIDRETKLLTRSTMTVPIPNVGEVSIVTDIGGYKPVAGVMMSTTMTQVAEGIATTNVAFDDTSVNAAVDAKIFSAR